MVCVGERQINMPRGWIVQYKDGTVLCEADMLWIKLPNKKNIDKVFLKWEERLWSIDDQEHFIVPAKRGYVDISPTGLISEGGIQSRTIGYYDLENKCKVIYRVDEATGRMQHETIPIK
jgi:hypothetical protein